MTEEMPTYYKVPEDHIANLLGYPVTHLVLSWSLREILDHVEVRKQKTPVEREAFRAKRRKEAKGRKPRERRAKA